MNLKPIGWSALALAVAVGTGWVWGASGKNAVEHQRDALAEQLDFATARAEILDARVSLYQVNFGQAGQHLEAAAHAVSGAQARLRETGQAERAGRLEVVLGDLRDAARLASSVDASAQSAAEQALQALEAARQ